MVPVSLSPSFFSVRVDSRFCPLTSVSHFQVPLGSAFLTSSARARPHSPSANAAARTAFMVILPQDGRGGNVARRGPTPRPLAPIIGAAGRRVLVYLLA